MRTVLLVGTTLALLAAAARTAAADVLRLVNGQRVQGVIAKEARQGVWIEVAPRVAVYYEYDRVVRAEKWTPERNAELITRPDPPPPLTEAERRGRVAFETPEGLWVQIEPRMARLIEHDRVDELRRRRGDADDGGNSPSRLAELRALEREDPPLSTAQVVRRVGPPDRRTRRDGRIRYEYDLPDGRMAVLHFREGRLDYVDVTRPE